MKKAKIMLIFIAVLATIGGAWAFKVKDKANVWCVIGRGTPDVVCVLVPYTTQFYFPLNITTTDPCPEETVFFTERLCITPYVETEENTVYVTDL